MLMMMTMIHKNPSFYILDVRLFFFFPAALLSFPFFDISLPSLFTDFSHIVLFPLNAQLCQCQGIGTLYLLSETRILSIDRVLSAV